MNQKENGALKAIAKHVGVLNQELGIVKSDVSLMKKDGSLMKNDIHWIKKIGWFLSTIITVGVGKVIFFG